MRHWLVKSEPDAFSFADLLAAPGSASAWDGVRNYQARNFMRDEMEVGDPVLFYHSNATPPAIVGLAEVASEPYPDPTQFDAASRYHDPKATPESPRWYLVDIRAVRPLPRAVTLQDLKENPVFAGMRLLQRGNRLSVMPVDAAHFEAILQLAGDPSD